MKPQRTPGVWAVHKPKGKSSRGIGPSPDVIVARVLPLMHNGVHHAIPNAEFIVRSCNFHEDLLAAFYDLQMSPGCWCLTGDGNPHSPACLAAANIAARIEAAA